MKLVDRWRSHKRAVWIFAFLLLAAAGAYYYFAIAGRDAGPVYREVKVARGDLAVGVLSTGIVQPRNRLEIKPPIPGRVEQVLVQEGQQVARGTVMAWMSSSERAALLDAARAKGPEEVKRWEELYRATPILAPIHGTLILRNVEPGQSFTSADAVFVMSDRLIVNAQVDETDIARIKLRQAVHITLDAYPDTHFEGQVGQIAYDAKTVNNVTTYEVEVIPIRAPAFMRSGMTANVNFEVAKRRDVLLIPAESIRVRDGRSFVLRPAPGNGAKPVEQPVEIGLGDGKHSELISGVSDGDTLLAPSLKTGKRNSAGTPFAPKRH